MDKLRAELAARYKQAPKEDKPQVQLCDTCGKSIYDSKICMQSGRIHDNKKTKLIGGNQVDTSKRTFTAKELIEAIDAIRVRWQAAKTQHVKVDVDSINIFQSFVLSRQWKQQRAGILYGTVEGAGDVVTVHAIYEPEQHSTETEIELLPDEREEKIDKLAHLCGWQRVGMICSHPPRDAEESSPASADTAFSSPLRPANLATSTPRRGRPPSSASISSRSGFSMKPRTRRESAVLRAASRLRLRRMKRMRRASGSASSRSRPTSSTPVG